ncbi:MAG TPA: integrase arm-type DNA-binding domain-containing protein [Sphingopyxis sp.]|nr:integrase arm-type DNA-binding domain-containing protein [Sphingopyxis sp.]HWV59601.1 integrase arm-type DNA-binding domain-containing protein [Sphingopyxis sp.]
MALKDLEIKYAARRSRDYKLFDGEGLYVLVTPRGSKLWRLKYFFDGKEKTLSLGKYPAISAAAARQMRREAKKLVADGIDPGEHRRSNKGRLPPQTLFEPIARAWHANRCEALDAAHASRVMSRLERDVFPVLGQRDIKSITAPEILEVVRAVEARGALDVSRRVKQSIGQVFRFAIASGWATNDPTTSINDALRPRPRVKHMPKVPLAELPELVAAIRSYDGEADARRRATTRDAMMFTLLTWARTSETRFASWDEIDDLDGEMPLWRLPAERMKMHREHVVPLSSQVVELLLRRRARGGHYIFEGDKPGHPISENTMIFACYRMGYRGRQTVHGFRGLASTWANEAECFKPDWIEMALAHADEDEVRGAYNSALYMSPRRRMLQRWADEIYQESPLVTPRAQMRSSLRQVSKATPGTRGEARSERLSSERLPFWQRPDGRRGLPKPRFGS